MELKEFIRTAITDITDAISDLQNELTNGAIVNPTLQHAISSKTVCQNGENRLISNIDFDVAITVGNTDTSKGSLGAGIQIFSAKLSGGNEARTENVSRMTFSVPIIFPSVDVKPDDQRHFEQQKNDTQKSLHQMREVLRSRSSD